MYFSIIVQGLGQDGIQVSRKSLSIFLFSLEKKVSHLNMPLRIGKWKYFGISDFKCKKKCEH